MREDWSCSGFPTVKRQLSWALGLWRRAGTDRL